MYLVLFLRGTQSHFSNAECTSFVFDPEAVDYNNTIPTIRQLSSLTELDFVLVILKDFLRHVSHLTQLAWRLMTDKIFLMFEMAASRVENNTGAHSMDYA